jgi:hypothetical protein
MAKVWWGYAKLSAGKAKRPSMLATAFAYVCVRPGEDKSVGTYNLHATW